MTMTLAMDAGFVGWIGLGAAWAVMVYAVYEMIRGRRR